MNDDKGGEMYSGGYTGKVLRVDLTDKTYSGGAPARRGGARLHRRRRLHRQVPLRRGARPTATRSAPRTSSSSPAARSPARRSPAPAAWRSTPSRPLTGAMGVALTGGHFPVEMKRAGYDVIIVEGKAEKPTYLWIKDGEVSFRSAEELWGLHEHPTAQQVIKDELHDQNVRVSLHRPGRARSSPAWPASSTSAAWPAARAWAPSWARRTSRPSPCAVSSSRRSPTRRSSTARPQAHARRR